MKKKEEKLVKTLLGNDIYDTLKKNGIVKPYTNTVTDEQELKIGLQIVPRTILSFLMRKLKYLKKDEATTIELPFVENARLELVKYGPDNYSGDLIHNNEVISKFKYRSIPSIGILILSSFELYDIDVLRQPIQQNPTTEQKNLEQKLQDIIEERLRLRELVEMVVDKKISQQEAIKSLIKEKIHAFLTEKRYEDDTSKEEIVEKDPEEEAEIHQKKYMQSLKDALQLRLESDSKSSDSIICEDCDTVLFKKGEKSIKCCICHGEFMDAEIPLIKKKDGTFSLKFPKNFEPYNIKTLLKAIKRSKHGK